jgi:hypothetical protein
VNESMANHLLYIPLHLIQSELSQKEEAKPEEQSSWESSQGGTAMPRHEVASLPSLMGSPLGRCGGRASPFRAKSASLPCSRIRRAAQSVSGALTPPARPAITSDPRNTHPTDEVPRRLDPPDRVPGSYKSDTKGFRHASVMGTVSSRPHLQGQQQRRSRGRSGRVGGQACSERQNLNVFAGGAGFMDSVSSAVAATQWPGQTSSGQPAATLRNRSQQPGSRRRTVPQG